MNRRQRLLWLIRTLPRRAWLTLRYLGVREFVRRAVLFPVRIVRPVDRSARRELPPPPPGHVRRWYAEHAHPVCIVIPHYGDPQVTIDAVESIEATLTRPELVRIVVTDDGS